MLTLTHNNKTYKVSLKNAVYTVDNKGFELIDRIFILEELKPL